MQKLFFLIFLFFILSFSGAFSQQVPPIPQPPINRGEQGGTIQNNDGQNQNEQIQNKRENIIIPNSNKKQILTLSAQLYENSPIIEDGIVWRVFDNNDENGMALLYKSEQAIAQFELREGDYLIHAAYGHAQLSDSLRIAGAPLTKTLNFEAGALRLNAAISGDIEILPKNLKFDIFANIGGEKEKKIIAKDVKQGETIYLNAGTYHVISYFGDVNAKVRADLRVEVGQLTDATLYHNAARISFRLASEPGGQAIADVEWTVKNQQGEILYKELGAFPSTILREGDYVVIAKIGQKVYNRDFQVQPSPPREIELLTSVY